MKQDELFESVPEPEALKAEIRCVTPPDAGRFLMTRYNVPAVECVVKRDASVVGGFNIFVGDDNYDWSTLGRIRQLRKSFQSLRRERDPEKIISLLYRQGEPAPSKSQVQQLI